ncbi:unnamed protein product [Boreogadus saida]
MGGIMVCLRLREDVAVMTPPNPPHLGGRCPPCPGDDQQPQTGGTMGVSSSGRALETFPLGSRQPDLLLLLSSERSLNRVDLLGLEVLVLLDQSGGPGPTGPVYGVNLWVPRGGGGAVIMCYTSGTCAGQFHDSSRNGQLQNYTKALG